MSALSAWTKKIEESELPILQYTATSIMHKVDKDDTSASQLAKIILRDSSLTARLLRIANSVIINPGRIPMNTINRTVLFLGFDMIRSLCLSLSLIDTLLKSKAKEHVKRLMARSFHCAVMARELAERRGDKAPEEVFVAALLSSIGEMAFWCVADDTGEEIFRLAEEKSCSLEQAQQEVLGFRFEELTVALTSGLSVGSLLEKSFSKSGSSSPRIREIRLGKQFAEIVQNDQENAGRQKIIMEMADHLKLDESRVREMIGQQVETVQKTVREYGAGDLVRYLPCQTEEDDGKEIEAFTVIPDCEFPESDPAVQLGIMKDLGNALESNAGPNTILQMVLEGINRGVGMDRALFALISKDRKMLVGKYALGNYTQSLNDRFRFLLEGENIFQAVFEEGKGERVEQGKPCQVLGSINTGILHVLETNSFLLYPIVINRKPIGMIYADRQPSQREITEEYFTNFKYFGQQARMALEHIAGR